MIPRYFQHISRLQYVFYVLAVFYIVTNSFMRTEGFISRVGFGVALLGIGFTVGSLSDGIKPSTKEKEIFTDSRKFRKHTNGLLATSITVLCSSFFLIGIVKINTSLNSVLAEQYSNLGYGMMALSFGLFFDLKQVFEKRRLFVLQK